MTLHQKTGLNLPLSIHIGQQQVCVLILWQTYKGLHDLSAILMECPEFCLCSAFLTSALISFFPIFVIFFTQIYDLAVMFQNINIVKLTSHILTDSCEKFLSEKLLLLLFFCCQAFCLRFMCQSLILAIFLSSIILIVSPLFVPIRMAHPDSRSDKNLPYDSL